jgi:hypothetical protein
MAGRLVPILVVAVALAAALTAPGRATAEWVQRHLSEVTGQVLRVPVNPSTAVPRTGALPGGGRMLAVTGEGLFAHGLGGAPRKLLGRVDTAAWSPHGRYAVAVRGIELIAVSMRGRRHWSLPARGAIAWPAWSPSGYRIAYVVGGPRGGRTIHVVAGDGSGSRPLAATRATPPAWWPGSRPGAERLATVDSAARVTLRDVDSGRVLWRTRTPLSPRMLAWSADGRRVLALQRDRLTVIDGATGRRLARHRVPRGSANVAVAARPGHPGYAVLRRTAGGASRAVVVRTDASGRRVLDESGVLFAGGSMRALAWSPRGDWLAAEPVGVDGWDLVHLKGRGVDRIRTLAAGRDAQLAGWCCR